MTARLTTPAVIVGAGCAALSLAVHLTRAEPRARLTLVDPREEYLDDRTWCAFRCAPHPFSHLVAHRWDRVAVRAEGREALATLRQHPYEMLNAKSFYDAALAELERAPGVRFERARVTTVTTGRVETSAGSLAASHVFDSRPLPNACEGGLAQCFAGVVVRSDTPRFDPSVAILMDFVPDADSVRSAGDIRFTYTLPFDAHTALVEDTYFSQEPRDVAFPQIDGALVLRRESGILPMTSRPPPRTPPGVTRIGVSGGAAKPSTGYAFDFIQRHSEALTRDFDAPVPRLRRHRMLDDIFLAELRAHPERAPALFHRMFARNCGDRLARFLMEASSPRDEVGVMATLPWLPFTLRGLSSSRRWLQERRVP